MQRARLQIQHPVISASALPPDRRGIGVEQQARLVLGPGIILECEWIFSARRNELCGGNEHFAFSGGRLIADDILRVFHSRRWLDGGVERSVVQPTRRTE